MKRIRTALHLLLLVSIGAAGCSGSPSEPVPPPVAAAPPTNRIAVPPTVRSNLGMTFARVERRGVDQTIRVPGAFELQPQARREYRLVLPGTVMLEVDQYTPVAPGDLLYRIRSPKWPELQHEIIEAEQTIDDAQASIAVAEAVVEEVDAGLETLHARLTALAAAGSRNATLEAEAAALRARRPRVVAEVRLAQTRLSNAQRTREHAVHRASAATGLPEARLMGEVNGLPAYRAIDLIDVRASEPGIVESLAVTDGAFAASPSLVLSTVAPERVRLRGVAMQADLPRIGTAPAGRITPPHTPTTGSPQDVEAEITFGLHADPAHRTLDVLATPHAYRPWMRPGVSAFLELDGEGPSEAALAIPRAAVVQDGLHHVFFRRDPDDPNSVLRVEADLGSDDGLWVVVNSGVGPGDEVVVDGAYELNLASRTSGVGQKGGHFHADGTYHAEDH